MATPVSVGSLNPLSNFNIGIGTVGNLAIILVLMVTVFVLVLLLIFFFAIKKSFNINIHAFRLIGNNPTRVATFSAKEIPFGMAGDKLWRVAPKGFMMPFKIIKWLPAGKFQSAPREFWYWIREDGEWINFAPTNIDKISKEMKVKFVQEDMRLQRLATEKLLEQRLLNKTFWEKYGLIMGYIFFFLVITVAMVIIFYQWSQIVDKIGLLMDKASAIIAQTNQPNSLVPA